MFMEFPLCMFVVNLFCKCFLHLSTIKVCVVLCFVAVCFISLSPLMLVRCKKSSVRWPACKARMALLIDFS